jgi:hypothetical protein
VRARSTNIKGKKRWIGALDEREQSTGGARATA